MDRQSKIRKLRILLHKKDLKQKVEEVGFDEFLESLKGQPGKDASPEKVAGVLRKDRGFITSLRGERGEAGKDGQDSDPKVVAALLAANKSFLSKVVGPTGKAGAPGVPGTAGLKWRGAWSTGVEYKKNDAVFDLGSSYICIATHRSAYENEPGVGALTPNYWTLLAQKGETGPAGAAGGAGGGSSESASVSDEAYGASWNGVTNVAPSKNAVYDKIETLGGSGDVVGPASATDNAIVRFDGTTGKLLQDYTATAPIISDSGFPTFQLGAVINESGADSDTRIESDGNANMVFVDASANKVGIGTSAPDEVLHVIGNLQIGSDITGDEDKGYRFRTSGSSLDLDFHSAALLVSGFDGPEYSGTQREKFVLKVGEDTSQMCGDWEVSLTPFGAAHHWFGSGALNGNFVVNEDSTASTFRVEGTNDASLISGNEVTDLVGIGTSTPAEKLDVAGNIATSGYVKIDSTPNADHQGNGMVAAFVANENQAIGDVCYINSSGEMQLADADAIATALVAGMCIDATISADATGNYLLMGIARDDTWNWTVGGLVYLSTTGTSGNTLTQTAPSGTDDCVVVVGVATHADRILFKPSFQGIVEVV